ncbi:MAG: class I SAM-dependent methyltransferase [Bacteroidetes bacterium]|nr:class I SAM-dependent methyltransferase [Bacteroidota bacterium]
MTTQSSRLLHMLLLALCMLVPVTLFAQEEAKKQSLDERVKAFLESRDGDWHDMNIPVRDGEFLYDLIVENNYTRALEIGTSTGHSAVWIAWALSKTGGTLTTIEIDEDRHKEALANFEEAGVLPYIDARLADAHELVKQLDGPFDFVFSDADKGWYKQYFIDVAPKMIARGCFTAHNISRRGGTYRRGVQEFVEYIQTRPDFVTTFENERTSGISLSYKRAEEMEEGKTN